MYTVSKADSTNITCGTITFCTECTRITVTVPFNDENEKVNDFRETSTACFSWYAELRTFRIFEISLSVQNIYEMFLFSYFFNSVRLFENVFSRKLRCL